MKALVKYEKEHGRVELRDIPEPTPGPGEVKCRVVKAGICGSDIHVYHNTMNYTPPVVMGHEFVGYITEVGEGVTQYQPGDRVTAEIGHYVCGTCDLCREGITNMCVNRKSMGYVYDGVFAEYVIVPERDIILVPKEIDSVSAMLAEPLACCCRGCFDFVQIRPGMVVVIFGPGPMGQMIAQICKASGAVVVVAGIERDTERLKLAKELGADYVLNTDQEDLKALVLSLTRGYGADVAFECSESVEAVNTGMDILKKTGAMIQFANHGRPIDGVNWHTIFAKELRIFGAMSAVNHNFRQAVDLLKRQQVNIKPIGDSLFKLEDWQEAIEMYESKQGYKVGFDISPDEY